MKQEIAVNVNGTEFGFSLFDLKVIVAELECLYPEANIASFTSSRRASRGELVVTCKSVNLDPWIIEFTRSNEWIGCFGWTHSVICTGDVP